MTSSKSSDVLAAWETSSQYWNKHQAVIDRMFTPLTRALIEHAHINPGQSVLDIGGGAGEPSLSIAKVIGDSGKIMFTDSAQGMVQSAKAEAERRGLTNIEFRQAEAGELPFADDTFDVAVSRLSAMFFPETLPALKEILRVVRPGGYVSFLVWARREDNPFFSVVTAILDRFVPSEPEDEDAPAAFRFAAPGKLAAILKSAGAVNVEEQEVIFDVEAPIDADQFWELRTEMSDSFRTKLGKLSDDEVARVKAEVLAAASGYFPSGSMKFPSKAIVVTARRS